MSIATIFFFVDKTFKKREVEKALTYEEKLRARLEEFSK